MSRARPLVLRRPEQVRATASPVAHRIIAVMERLRAATVGELADAVGIEAGSLYYHVRRLHAVGVLRERERRRTSGRPETVYELPGSEVVFDPRAKGKRFLSELGRSIRVRLRFVERTFQRALESGSSRRAGKRRNLSLHTHVARLGARDREELYRLVEELETFLVERDDPCVDSFLSVTIAVAPLEREADR